VKNQIFILNQISSIQKQRLGGDSKRKFNFYFRNLNQTKLLSNVFMVIQFEDLSSDSNLKIYETCKFWSGSKLWILKDVIKTGTTVLQIVV
jgi:hypothetical protein